MKIIADINISVAIVNGLRALGHDVERADAFLPPTATDLEIASLAERIKAAVLTRDQDFSTLLAMLQASAPSLLNLRHERTNSGFLIHLLDTVITRHDVELRRGAIITVDERGVRVHRLPIGSGE